MYTWSPLEVAPPSNKGLVYMPIIQSKIYKLFRPHVHIFNDCKKFEKLTDKNTRDCPCSMILKMRSALKIRPALTCDSQCSSLKNKIGP